MSKMNLSRFAVEHQTLVLFFLFLILISGIHAFFQLGRLEDPVFNIPSITIRADWPGADPKEMQNEVLDKIEQALSELDDFDYVTTYARQGFGAMTLWLKDEGSPLPVLERAWYQARKKVHDIQHTLPEGVQGPYFNDEYADVYSALYTLTSDTMSMAELLEAAKKIKVDLRAIPEIKKIDIFGEQPEKIYVELSSKKMASLGIHPKTIFDTLQQYNMLTPIGSVEGPVDQIFLRNNHQITNKEDIENLTIESNKKLLKLSTFSNVESGYLEPKNYAIRFNGKSALVIAISSKKNINILDLGEALKKKISGWQHHLRPQIELFQSFNQSKIVEESVSEFEESFLEALIIVLAVAFFSLGWRTGLVIAIAVPLVLSVVSVVMAFANWTLNRVTLGALIIALGLLVDDAIISTESMLVKIEQGWGKLKAATYAYTATAFPMLSGTLVTIAGFLPVAFAKSGSSEYASGIFWIVSVALITSWIVAVIFTPVIGLFLIQKPQHSKSEEVQNSQQGFMRQLARWCIIHRNLVLIVTSLLLVIAALEMLFVQQQFFPTTSRKELIVDLRLKEGASFKATEAEVKKVEKLLTEQKGIEYFTAYLGGGSPRFFLSLAPELPNLGYAQFIILAKSLSDRDRLVKGLRQIFRDDLAYANVRARVTLLDFGPPTGFPVQFRIIGKDLQTLRDIAYQVFNQVQKSPLVRDTQLNWNEKVRIMKVQIDDNKALKAGLNRASIADQLNTFLYGSVATRLRRGDELIDVIIRGNKKERNSLKNLDDIYVFTTSGKAVPAAQVATFIPALEEPVLWRRNREFMITVRSDLADGIQGPDATQQIWPTLKEIRQNLPDGYRIEIGGAKEESDKANHAINAVVPIMMVSILIILMIQLQSLSLLVMVLLSAPLGLIGVAPALLLLNSAFGFVALLGLIALGGMIMRNTVILVEQIEQHIEDGLSPWDAIIESTVSRARPVFLTALSAILAMIPLSSSLFWGPMAIVIMGGLLAATGLTLIFVPALYAFWHKVKPEEENLLE